jgi:uncharacterized protein (TIGR02246 family)
MRKLGLVFLASLSLVAGAAFAQPVKEVADMGPARMKAFMSGDADGWTTDMADNASFHSQYSPFRIDGRPAIRAYFADLYNRYPGPRNLQVSQATSRAYGDSVVVANGYYQLTLTDKAGKPVTSHARYSVTWVKTDGRWKIVDQHNAALPSQ